ncbi:MAG: F0F1 ATP synthase subunit gamma [Alphaproteobacteria bacterium]
MANLKDLRNKISSVTSTRRITSAMKMVAAAKLRRAQDMAESARPYAERMERMLSSLAASAAASPESAPPMLAVRDDSTHLLVLISSDRGLCGGFNAYLIRFTRERIAQLERDGKTVKIIIVGRKGLTALRRDMSRRIVEKFEDLAKPAPAFSQAQTVSEKITGMFEAGEFDVCTIIYNKFVSALTQEVTPLQLIPFKTAALPAKTDEDANPESRASYEFEPDEEEILAALLPRNLSVQVYRAMLESFASEQAARMTAMDNATRNAGDMIESLTLRYNRTRQAAITSELIEIISGAEAL